MSIRLIVESVLQSTYLSRRQESQICHFLQERLYDELDLEAIDRLIFAEGASPARVRGKLRRFAKSSGQSLAQPPVAVWSLEQRTATGVPAGELSGRLP